MPRHPPHRPPRKPSKALEKALQEIDKINERREVCTYCGSEIDPETCQCGSPADDHGYWEGHSPVPMGCTCHMKIEIVEADRPADDTPEEWRRLVSNYLKDESRQRRYADDDFVECDVCNSKPGSPALCAGCLANRETISRLRGRK